MKRKRIKYRNAMNDTNFKIKKNQQEKIKHVCSSLVRIFPLPNLIKWLFEWNIKNKYDLETHNNNSIKKRLRKQEAAHTHTKICKYTLHESHGTWSLYDFAVYFIRRNTQLLVMKVFKFFFRMTWDSDTVTIKPYRTSKVQVKAKSCLQCFFSSCGLGLCGEMLSLYAFYRCICWVHLENRISSFNNKLSFRWR